jgi:L-malate glycosyltransferase
MNIGIVCYPSIGGSGLVATELGVNLGKLGHQVHFISYSVPFKLSNYNRNVFFHSVDPINYPLFNQTLYTFSLTAKIVDIVNDYKLDVVHAHYSIPHSLCAHLAREVSGEDFKIVTTLHGTDVTIVGRNKPLFSLNKYGIEQSDHVTTVSEFQREYTYKYFKITKDIEVIYNFVDTDVFKPGIVAGRSCLTDSDEKIVMHISNFRPPKNPEGVIKTFHLIRTRVPAKLVLIGDGPGIGEIRNLCKEYDICEHVCFLGQVDNVETVIPMADCILQPSFQESFGMVLLEAMACEIPTVSSNVDGIPEVVVHNETGFTADPDDHAQMAEHVIELFRSDGLAKKMGRKGRQRAMENFNKDRMIARYVDCYHSA